MFHIKTLFLLDELLWTCWSSCSLLSSRAPPGFQVEWPQLRGRIMRKLFFSDPNLAELSFCWLLQIPAQPTGTPTWYILGVCANFRQWETGRSSVLVTASYSFGGTGICYASAQMTWLKEHMGDKNQDSYASYYIHGLAVRGSAEHFLWLLALSQGLLSAWYFKEDDTFIDFFFLSIWPKGKIRNVLR